MIPLSLLSVTYNFEFFVWFISKKVLKISHKNDQSNFFYWSSKILLYHGWLLCGARLVSLHTHNYFYDGSVKTRKKKIFRLLLTQFLNCCLYKEFGSFFGVWLPCFKKSCNRIKVFLTRCKERVIPLSCQSSTHYCDVFCKGTWMVCIHVFRQKHCCKLSQLISGYLGLRRIKKYKSAYKSSFFVSTPRKIINEVEHTERFGFFRTNEQSRMG